MPLKVQFNQLSSVLPETRLQQRQQADQEARS